MELERGFEDDAREALLDDVESKLIGSGDNVTHQLVQAVHENFREYGREHDYDVEPILDSLQPPEVTRSRDGIAVRLEWDHVAAHYMEMGTSDHTIQGQPVLSFVWERRHDPPEWVQEEFDREGDGWRVFLAEVEVSGLPEGRMVRDALRYIELVVTGRTASGVGS